MKSRIDEVVSQQYSEATHQLLTEISGPGQPANLFHTVAANPVLLRRWLPLAGQLLAGQLPARDRELLILRTAWNCQAEYCWGHHVLIGGGVGISSDEIEQIRVGPSASGWGAFDNALLNAADELHTQLAMSNHTWEALSASYTHGQLVEVTMLIGHYHMMAMLLKTLKIRREDGIPGLRETAI
jgi:alkylhydroperoxidase family enzyme